MQTLNSVFSNINYFRKDKYDKKTDVKLQNTSLYKHIVNNYWEYYILKYQQKLSIDSLYCALFISIFSFLYKKTFNPF